METLGKHIRHAWRMFRESKLFTATAIAALTLGIGVNIAIFSIVNAVLLKPIPFPDPDTLVQLVNTNNGTAGGNAASPAKYMHWRAQTEVLESVAAVRTVDAAAHGAQLRHHLPRVRSGRQAARHARPGQQVALERRQEARLFVG